MTNRNRTAKGQIMAHGRGMLAGALALALAGCELGVENPNAQSEDDVLGSGNGLVTLAIGMQDEFAEEFEEMIQASALVTDEWGTSTSALLAYRNLFTGVDVTADLGLVEQPWADAYRVVNMANDIIANVPTTSGLPEGLAPGLTAVAKLYKGMALGLAATQFERLLVNPEGTLVPRGEVFDSVLATLESARADLANADVALLNSRVAGSGFDVPNTIDAMLARYYLFDGQFQDALEAAQRVDLGVRSVMPYSAPDLNPIFQLSNELAYVFPLRSFATTAEAGDQRPAYWANTQATAFVGIPDSLLIPHAQYTRRTDPIPIYLPDEMKLVQAEAYTRLGDFANARRLINEVRTQSVNPPVAGLPALPVAALDTEPELLRQILYERRYELFLQGVRWEDLRRLAPYTTVRPTVSFLPIPRQECLNNPNITC